MSTRTLYITKYIVTDALPFGGNNFPHKVAAIFVRKLYSGRDVYAAFRSFATNYDYFVKIENTLLADKD